jgi:uncharacterized protein (DUF2267 family)
VSRFVFAPGAVGPMIEDDDVRRLDEANAELRATLREVRDELGGASPADVLAALTTRLAERVGDDFTISEGALREYAAAISEGTLFG